MADIDPYISSVEARIEELNAGLLALKARAKEEGADAELQFQKAARQYEVRKAELEKTVKDLHAKSGDSMKDMQEGIEAAIRELGAAFDKAKSRFS